MRSLRDFCLRHHISALWDVAMAPYTTFRIGGNVSALLLPCNEEELTQALRFLSQNGYRFRVIGNASNLLFDDSGYRGVLISTRHMRSLSWDADGVRASAGAPLNDVIRRAAEKNLGGFGKLCGIPATVGGAIFMNAGAFGLSVSDFVSFVNVWDTKEEKMRILSAEECLFSYRSSIFSVKREWIILSASLRLERVPCREGMVILRETLQKRQEKQPLFYPSAGSVFRRPEGYYVGELVEKAGLLGKKEGGACVSSKHGGFIVNLGGASSSDVLTLIALIKQEIKNRFSVDLELEIEYMM